MEKIHIKKGFESNNWKGYKKKPIKIEAVQLDFDCVVETLEGNMQGKAGDYLIKGVEGELYVCKKEIFKKTYEKFIPPAVREDMPIKRGIIGETNRSRNKPNSI